MGKGEAVLLAADQHPSMAAQVVDQVAAAVQVQQWSEGLIQQRGRDVGGVAGVAAGRLVSVGAPGQLAQTATDLALGQVHDPTGVVAAGRLAGAPAAGARGDHRPR